MRIFERNPKVYQAGGEPGIAASVACNITHGQGTSTKVDAYVVDVLAAHSHEFHVCCAQQRTTFLQATALTALAFTVSCR